jgi:hypothetical protein
MRTHRSRMSRKSGSRFSEKDMRKKIIIRRAFEATPVFVIAGYIMAHRRSQLASAAT